MTTRGKLKKEDGFYLEEDSDGDDEFMLQCHNDLVEAEEARKKRLEEKRNRNYVSIKLIPEELWPKIFSYLDSSKEIFQLSTMCKSFRGAISPGLVVQTAVYEGGNRQ